jgi:hypothetical protein
MIRSLTAAAAVDVLDHDRRVSRNVFLQKRLHGLYPEISGSAWRCGRDQGNGLTFIKIALGKRFSR